MTVTYGAVVKTSSTATGLSVPLADTTTGALNALWVSANSTGTGVQPQIQVPAGWTLAPNTSAWKSGSPSHEVACLIRARQVGDATSVQVNLGAAGGGNLAIFPMAFSPGMIDVTTPIIPGESLAANSAGPTIDVTPAVTVGGARYVYSGFANRNGSTATPWAAATDTNVHDPIVGQGAQSSAASIAVCGTGATTASGAARSLVSPASTSINNTLIVAFNPASGGATATGATAMTSTTAMSSQGNTAGSASLTSATALTSASPAGATAGSTALSSATALTTAATSPIIRLLQAGGQQWAAHRGGFSSTLGEGTLEAYTAALAQYSKAILELSVRQCSTGEWVVIHDPTTGRAFTGASVTVSATPWSTLSTYTSVNGGNLIRRLTDILSALPNAYYVIDNKQDTNAANLTALLNSAVPGRWMGKQFYSASGTWLTACQNAGAPVWGYFYPADLTTANLNAFAANLSTAKSPVVAGLGDYSASPVPVQSDANTFHAWAAANGLMTWAHILSTSAQRNTADSQAAAAGSAFNGYMTSGYATLAPTDGPASAMTSGSSFGGGQPSRGQASSAAFASASGLTTSSPAATSTSTVAMTSTTALTAGPPAGIRSAAGSPMVSQSAFATVAVTSGQQAGAVLVAATGLGASPAGASPSGGAMTSSTGLIGATPALGLVAGGMMASATGLIASLTVAVQGAGAMTSTSAFGSAQPAIGRPGSAAVTSATGLSALPAGASPAGGVLTSASTLTSEPPAVVVAAGSALSVGTVLGASAARQQNSGAPGWRSGTALIGSAAVGANAAGALIALTAFAGGASSVLQLVGAAAVETATRFGTFGPITGGSAAAGPMASATGLVSDAEPSRMQELVTFAGPAVIGYGSGPAVTAWATGPAVIA